MTAATYWILREREPVAVGLKEWSAWMLSEPQTIAGGGGPPILFETMIFGGKHDQWQDRYSTWEQAEAGHNQVVAALKEGRDLP